MIGVALAAFALCLASAAADDPGAPPRPVRREPGAPSLSLRLALQDVAAPLALEPRRPDEELPPSCVADWCQPRVDVPGMGAASATRGSRTELFVAILDRAGLEPLASIGWFFVATGLRADWSPANQDASFGASAGGWGSAFVRLRIRIDAWNLPALPMRPRDRLRRAREHEVEEARALAALRQLEAERRRARDAERERERPRDGAAQRPARLSST